MPGCKSFAANVFSFMPTLPTAEPRAVDHRAAMAFDGRHLCSDLFVADLRTVCQGETPSASEFDTLRAVLLRGYSAE